MFHIHTVLKKLRCQLRGRPVKMAAVKKQFDGFACIITAEPRNITLALKDESDLDFRQAPHRAGQMSDASAIASGKLARTRRRLTRRRSSVSIVGLRLRLMVPLGAA